MRVRVRVSLPTDLYVHVYVYVYVYLYVYLNRGLTLQKSRREPRRTCTLRRGETHTAGESQACDGEPHLLHPLPERSVEQQ